MNSNQRLDDTPENDAVMVTAGQVLAFLHRHIKKFALTGIVGGVVAIGVALMLPKQWEASAALQIGQIASEAPQSPAIPIETVGRAMERLQLPQFKDVVLQKLGLPLGVSENANTDLIRRSLKVTQLKNADLIQLTVRGFSQADAQRYAKAFLGELVGAHAALAKPSIDQINANMAEVTRSIVAEEARKTQLAELARVRDQAKHTETFPAAVLLANMTAENDKRLQALHQREISIREQLNPERTFNTRLFGPMFVSPHHVFPSGLIFAAVGVVLGLLVAVGWGLFSDCRQRIFHCCG